MFQTLRAEGPGPELVEKVRKKEEKLTDRSKILEMREEWGSIQNERIEQETSRMSGRKTLRKKGWRLRRKWNSRARQLWFPMGEQIQKAF